jgi:hypothetical protein
LGVLKKNHQQASFKKVCLAFLLAGKQLSSRVEMNGWAIAALSC